MKIFSNFDTNYRKKVVASYVEEYGSENILVINRSKLFGWSYVHLPFLGYTIIAILIIYLTVLRMDVSFMRRFIVVIVFLAWAVSLLPVMKKYIDYKLDFTIVTPKGVFLFNQTGILNRNMTSLNVNNIRSIVVNKSGLIYSIFNNGDIRILSEGSDNELGEVQMKYVNNPEMKRAKIKQIFSRTNITNY